MILAACGGSSLSAGHVIAKDYDPGHYYVWEMPVYRTQCQMEETEVGSSMEDEDVCTQMLSYYLPEQMWQPPSWGLELKDGKQTGWTYVTPAQFAKARIGQWWGKITPKPSAVKAKAKASNR